MDIQMATILSGQKWQFARIGALVCLLLACGFLASSLLERQTIDSPKKATPTWGQH